MPKNIVILSDGTGGDGGRNPDSNVYKLFKMLESRTDRQIVFYDRGVGATPDWSRGFLLDMIGWGLSRFRQLFARGFSRNVLDCYRFIFENYSPGDQVFLFGFSRGAATIRSLSAFIHLFGVLPRSRPELIGRAFTIYKLSDKCKRERESRDFWHRHHPMWLRIKFLGAWDTVPALGGPYKRLSAILDRFPFWRHRFHDLELSESVEHARHALAIDEERKAFLPKYWDAKLGFPYQTVKQVWFRGVHSDVGGSYEEQELSDIPLIWMVKEAQQHNLRLYPQHEMCLHPDPDGVMHDSRSGFFGRFFIKKTRFWDYEGRGNPVVHQSVLMRRTSTKNSADPYEPWILARNVSIEPWPDAEQLVPQRLVGVDAGTAATVSC